MAKESIEATLEAEYFHLQRVIEDFDSRALSIKGWSVTFSLATIAAAFAGNSRGLLFLSLVSTLMFWLIEALWKSFQNAYYQRIEAIEAHFSGERPLDAPLQIGRAWFGYWNSGGRAGWARILLWPHVCLPHVVVALIASALLLLPVFGAG